MKSQGGVTMDTVVVIEEVLAPAFGYHWTMVGDLALIKVVHEAFTPAKDELTNLSDLDRLATEAEKTNSLISFTPIPTSSCAASSPWPTWQGSQEPRLGHGSLGLVK